MTWIKQILEQLFPGDQLTTLLEMVGMFAMILGWVALRMKFWQDREDSGVFLTKQRFQTLFGKKENVNK